MNLVIAGAVATTPLVGCDSKSTATDAALHMDATGDGALAMDTAGNDGGIDTAKDMAVDLDDDASTDSYPDGVRG
jgi:hypothetical protein